jgi:hypothetical protein
MGEQDKNHAYAQAVAQATSIDNMVGALNVDYDRLEELRKACSGYDTEASWSEHNPEESEELRELEEAANGNKHHDEALEAIHNDPLDVQVRGEWHNPDETHTTPSEFMILLCTGGPAVRIMGELNDYCEPTRAWIEYQDWGTPWTEAPGIISQDVLLQYCQQFYFGE